MVLESEILAMPPDGTLEAMAMNPCIIMTVPM